MILAINSSGTLMSGPSRSCTSNPDHTTLQYVDCFGSSRGGPKCRHSFLWRHIFVVDVVLVEELQPLCDLFFVYIMRTGRWTAVGRRLGSRKSPRSSDGSRESTRLTLFCPMNIMYSRLYAFERASTKLSRAITASSLTCSMSYIQQALNLLERYNFHRMSSKAI